MEESLIYSNVAYELLEIFKYLDKDFKSKIPSKVEESLKKISNKTHEFKLDKTKELIEQDLLPQTKQILSIIYLKYCCSSEEVSNVLQENYERQREKEIEKSQKYNSNNIFKEIKEEDNRLQLLKIEDIPWYRKVFRKISKFFNNIFGK